MSEEDIGQVRDPVVRTLRFRRVRWYLLLFYVVLLPFALVFLHPLAFILLFVVTAVGGAILFFRRGRHRLDERHFERLEPFATASEVLVRTHGTHLYLRERYSRDSGKPTPLRIRRCKSIAGIKSLHPFLVVDAARHRLLVTPQTYWLRVGPTIITGPTRSVAIETFEIEDKVARPRSDDEVLGSTWLYATKSGERDLRFNDNHELWLVRRHAVELSFEDHRWAVCLYGIANARLFLSAMAEFAPQPLELEYHPEKDDQDERLGLDSEPRDQRRWHEILEVSPDATIGEIKTAYRGLLEQYHPDLVATFSEKVRRVASEEAGEIRRAYKDGLASRGQVPP